MASSGCVANCFTFFSFHQTNFVTDVVKIWFLRSSSYFAASFVNSRFFSSLADFFLLMARSRGEDFGLVLLLFSQRQNTWWRHNSWSPFSSIISVLFLSDSSREHAKTQTKATPFAQQSSICFNSTWLSILRISGKENRRCALIKTLKSWRFLSRNSFVAQSGNRYDHDFTWTITTALWKKSTYHKWGNREILLHKSRS